MAACDTVEDRNWVIIWGQHVLILYVLDPSQAFYVWILNLSVPVLWQNSLGMNMSKKKKERKEKKIPLKLADDPWNDMIK